MPFDNAINIYFNYISYLNHIKKHIVKISFNSETNIDFLFYVQTGNANRNVNWAVLIMAS